MLTETGLLQELNTSSNAGLPKITGVPCKWDGASQKFKVDRKSFLRSAIVIGFNLISIIVGVLQTIIGKRLYGIPVDLKTISMTFLIPGSIVMIQCSAVNHKEPELMEGFINQMVVFEARQLRQETQAWKSFLAKRMMTKLALITCKLTRYNGVTLGPFLAAASSVILPDLPFNMLRFYPSRLMLEVDTVVGFKLPQRMEWILGKVILFMWNWICWQFLGKYWCILVAQIETGCVGLSGMILTLNRQVQRGGLQSFSNFAETHRQIQILSGIFNKLESNILVTLLIGVSQAQIVSGLNMLSKGNSPFAKANISLTIFSTMMYCNGLFGLSLIFGICGQVHATSNMSLERMRRMLEMTAGAMCNFKEKRYQKRVIRSLRVIKIHFGGMNFIEKLTPIVFQNFTTMRLVDCLLLSKSR